MVRRHDMRSDVLVSTAAPHLAPGDFGDVLRRLKVVITKDSNVVCVAEAISCVGALAKVVETLKLRMPTHSHICGHSPPTTATLWTMLLPILVQGLRRDFHSSAKSFAPVLLDKFKDKNTGVCRATNDALVIMHK
jgi:hypothetical protein